MERRIRGYGHLTADENDTTSKDPISDLSEVGAIWDRIHQRLTAI